MKNKINFSHKKEALSFDKASFNFYNFVITEINSSVTLCNG